MPTYNTLASELKEAKELGFLATAKNSKARNPYMPLVDGSCLLWLAGGYIGIVTTRDYFGKKLYKTKWKSNDRNKPHATITATEIDIDGLGEHTEIYYREAYKDTIAQIAKDFGLDESEVVLDHINHMRGDCRRENLRPATKAQNNQNKSKVKVEHAFYTKVDVIEKIKAGEWVPVTRAKK